MAKTAKKTRQSTAGRTAKPRKKRTTAKADPASSLPLEEVEPEELARSEKGRGNGKDAYGAYLDDMTRNAPELLTPSQELQIGRLLSEYVDLAIEAMLKDVEEAGRLLSEGGTDPVLRGRAARAIGYLNPEGLGNAELRTRLAERMGSTDADELFEMYAEDDAKELRDHFVLCNLRLTISMARRYAIGSTLSMSELVQEGNIGLMHAVLRFDYRKGFRFSTYAGWWIRHAIGRAIADKGRLVRIPVHMTEFHALVTKERARLTTSLGRAPSDVELAKALRLRGGKARVQKTDNGEPLTDKIRKLGTQLQRSVSFDQPSRTDDGDGATLYETLETETDEPPVWAPLKGDASMEMLRDAMTRLAPIEIDVLRCRFGLDDDEEQTFKEIGDRYRLSRERIRQIQNGALEKLRKDRLLKPLILEVAARAA